MNDPREWEVIDTYFRDNTMHMTMNQIDSFNDFVHNKIPYTIQTLNPIQVQKNDTKQKGKYHFKVYVGGVDGTNIRLSRPTYVDAQGEIKVLLPNEARLKDMDYVSHLYADVDIEYIPLNKQEDDMSNSVKQTFKDVKIGTIPIMLHSDLCILHGQADHVLEQMGECPYDKGGYFILRGKEKVIIAQESTAINQLFVKTEKPVYEKGNISSRFGNRKGKDGVYEKDEAHLRNVVQANEYSHAATIRNYGRDNSLFPKTINFKVYSGAIYEGKRRGCIVLEIPNIGNGSGAAGDSGKSGREIPLFIVFRALGIETDKQIIDHVIPHNKVPLGVYYNVLHACAADAIFIRTQNDALKYLNRFTLYNTDRENMAVHQILMDDLFPNMGQDYRKKAIYLGYLVRQILMVMAGEKPDTDRDSCTLKRVQMSGLLLSNIFRDFYNRFRNNIRSEVDKTYETNFGNKNVGGLDAVNINLNDMATAVKNRYYTIFPSSIIGEGMMKSMRGNWGASDDPDKQGIVQDLNRLSYMGYVSHVRRVHKPMDPSVKISEPHRIHTTQWGYLCPVESPDGANVGLLNHLSSMCYVTISNDLDFDALVKLMQDECDLQTLDTLIPGDVTPKVFLNGTLIGIVADSHEMLLKFKDLRSKGIVNRFTSIGWNIKTGELYIYNDAGRLVRPLFVLPNASTRDTYKELSWSDLIEQNYLEYVDALESENLMISMRLGDADNNPRNTHSEIHPSTILSLYTNTIPFAHHNQGPRNVFSGQQGKQAIGVYATNFNNRIDTASYILNYPQKCMVTTKYHRYANKDVLPNGANLIVAVATYTGYNQEDAVIINEDSIHRGLFNITYFKAYKDEETYDESTGERVFFKNPWLLEGRLGMKPKLAKWSDKNMRPFIDDEGLPIENSYIGEDDVFIGKVKSIETKTQSDEKALFENTSTVVTFSDRSVVGDNITNGIVDKVYTYRDNVTNLRNVKIRFRKMRLPELGDKMASMHGQKGTVGMVIPACDMPYTKDGVVPDLIVNPHAFPSRMTLGHIIETVFAKLCCLANVEIDGTIFESHDHEKIGDILEQSYGMERNANEIMYNPRTGEQLESSIFFGPTYYYRLKHMVKDKINYRNTGEMTNVTRQPTQGRAQGGGLRIGLMETNALLGHGISSFIRESMMKRSDEFEFVIDNYDGTIANHDYKNKSLNISFGSNPKSTHMDFSRVQAPYSLKLLIQELEALSITPRLLTDEHDDRYGVPEENDEEYVYVDRESEEKDLEEN